MSVMVAGTAIVWSVWDGRNLIRLWPVRREKQDEFFGVLMGLVIRARGCAGLVGTLRWLWGAVLGDGPGPCRGRRSALGLRS